MNNFFNCCFNKKSKSEVEIDIFTDFFETKTDISSSKSIFKQENTNENLNQANKISVLLDKINLNQVNNSSQSNQIPTIQNISSIPNIKSTHQVKLNTKISHKSVNSKHIKESSLSPQIITDIEVQENRKLILSEVDGNCLNGNKIEINASGIVKDGLRNLKNGVSYFGFLMEDDDECENNENLKFPIDYELNIRKINKSSNVIFKIFFDKVLKKYYLSSSVNKNDFTVVFIKVDMIKLVSKHIVSLGEIHISIENEPTNNSIKIDLINGNEEVKSKIYNKDYSNVIKIGRNKDNDFYINNPSLSRIHTSILYKKDINSWILIDGTDKKKSTNGNWVYLDDIWEITDKDLFFRIDGNFLKLKIIY